MAVEAVQSQQKIIPIIPVKTVKQNDKSTRELNHSFLIINNSSIINGIGNVICVGRPYRFGKARVTGNLCR
jgi:hypothetical protein